MDGLRPEDQNVQVGWRMAGLASETVSYVIAGGLLGWLADRGFETDFWLPTGFIVGIVTGIGVLLERGPQNEQGVGPSNRPKTPFRLRKGRFVTDSIPRFTFPAKALLGLWIALFHRHPLGWLVVAPLAGSLL